MVEKVSPAQLRRLRDVLIPLEMTAEPELGGAIPAAVLVTLYERDGILYTVFTERHQGLAHHPGEISFPGGRREAGDQSLQATALRETREELGLNPDTVSMIGALPPTPTIATGYAIYPFVGLIDAAHSWTPSTSEVAAVIELPLDALAAGYARRRVGRRGVQLRTDTYVVDGHVIWGATARIVADLLERLRA